MNALSCLTLVAIAVLAGCGGGDDGDAGTPVLCATCPAGGGSTGGGGGSSARATVEGYWVGSGGPYRFGTLVLENGDTFSIYLRGSALAGVGVGRVNSTSSTFSGDGTDFNFEIPAITPTTLAGTYSVNSRLQGTLGAGSRITQFTGAYDATYNTEVDLATLAGTWSGGAASRSGSSAGTATFAADGSFTAQTAACTGSGSVSTRRAGKHPLAVTVSLRGATCDLAGRTLRGVAVVAADGRSMVAMALNSARDDGFFAALSR